MHYYQYNENNYQYKILIFQTYINHYLNITSTYPGMRGTTNLTLAHETMKLTILLKSLTGLGSSTQGNMSDILVVNNRKTRLGTYDENLNRIGD